MDDNRLQNGRTQRDIYLEHFLTIYRLAFTFMGNRENTEEAVRRCFEKLMSSGESFAGWQDERAWLVDAITGVCFNMLGRRNGKAGNVDPAADATMKALIGLPDKYKVAAYFFYCEGLTAREISELVGEKPNIVSSSIDKVRRSLKAKLGGDFDD